MKKTLSIHFGRQLFIIEEDAYDLLQQYLGRLELSLRDDEGAAEIIEDIEMRFAELLLSYLGDARKVANADDISRGIASLGEPEAILDEEPNTSARQNHHNDQAEQSKRLFRDPDEGILGGICFGIASYFNIDPLIVRLLFVVLLFFVGMAIPLYIILWILMPVASTPSDRLRMKGKTVTIESLKEEFERAAEKIKSDTMKARDRFRSGNDAYMSQAKGVAQSLVRLSGMVIIAGTFIWMLFYACFTSGLIALIPSTGDSDYLTFGQFLRLVIPNDKTCLTMWIAILALGISTILMSFAVGIRMLTGTRHTWLKPVLFVNSLVFFAGIVAATIAGVQTGRDFSVYTELEMQQVTATGDSLVINEYSHYSNDKRIVATGGIDFINLRNGRISINGILLTYKRSADANFHIYQRASAHAVDRVKAIRRCEHIENICRLNGTTLTLDPMVSFPAKDGFRNQEVEVIIEIPEGKKLIVRGEEHKSETHYSQTETFRMNDDLFYKD